MMNELYAQFYQMIGAYLPSILGALAILVVGWVLALIIARITRLVIQRTKFDQWVASLLGEEDTQVDIAQWVSRIVYYLLLLFVIVGVLQALNLGAVAAPINQLLSQVLAYLPQIVGAGAEGHG